MYPNHNFLSHSVPSMQSLDKLFKTMLFLVFEIHVDIRIQNSTDLRRVHDAPCFLAPRNARNREVRQQTVRMVHSVQAVAYKGGIRLKPVKGQFFYFCSAVSCKIQTVCETFLSDYQWHRWGGYRIKQFFSLKGRGQKLVTLFLLSAGPNCAVHIYEMGVRFYGWLIVMDNDWCDKWSMVL